MCAGGSDHQDKEFFRHGVTSDRQVGNITGLSSLYGHNARGKKTKEEVDGGSYRRK